MEIKFGLHDAQMEVWESQARWRVLVAGRRFGKTLLAIHELMRKALRRPKAKVWYTAPYYAQAKMICWQMLQDILPKQIISKKNESELWVELINGSRISLKGVDNEDSLVGTGLDFIVPDEYALYKPHVWPKILRPMLADMEGGALFIGTPRGKNAFFELYLNGQRHEPGWASWQFPTRLNPFISLNEIEEAQKTLPDMLFRQEYEASFEDYIGLIWPEFNQDHVIKPTYLPSIYPKIGAIDPALSGTTGVLKAALDEDGTIIIYDEYYEPNKRASEVADVIKDEDTRWFIDPAASASTIQRDGKLYSFYDEYGDCGIRPDPWERDVDAGINRVGEFFKTNKIKIFNTCHKLIWELERYHWAEERETVGGIIKPKPYHKDCHLCDCLKGLVMSRQDKAHLPKEYVNPNSAWGRYLHEKEAKTGEFVYRSK